MIDPELKYCPNCKDEYREEFSTCASCNKELILGKELVSSVNSLGQETIIPTTINDDDTLAVLLKGSLLDMKNMKRQLEKAAIPAILAKDESNCGKGCCGTEMFLHIREEDISKAASVINSEFEKTTELHQYDLSTADAVFDQGAAMTTCPACGFQFMPTSSTCPDCGLQFA